MKKVTAETKKMTEVIVINPNYNGFEFGHKVRISKLLYNRYGDVGFEVYGKINFTGEYYYDILGFEDLELAD